MLEDILPLKLDEGKYEIRMVGGRLEAYRYGAPWRDLTGDNLIYWLLIQIAEERLHVENEDTTI